MSNEISARLSDHLVSLLQPTPSAAEKLIAAWDGLSTESQIFVLIAPEMARLSARSNEKLHKKALNSPNAYVRYLAAKGLLLSSKENEEQKAIKHRIEHDPDPLVRYCLLESSWGLSDRGLADADAFFNLPHEARLAKVRSLCGSGEVMANVISHGVDYHLKEGKVSAIELSEIISDYVNKAEFKNHYGPDNESHDGFTEYGRGKDIDALWHVVPKLPDSLSDILIRTLPTGAGLSSGIPEDVLSRMTDHQLTILFKREDVGLKELRKKIFFEAADNRDDVKCAAIWYNFDLNYTEFATILAKPKIEATRFIELLIWGHNLSLCFYQAIYDVVLSCDLGDPMDSEFARNAFDRRLEQLEGPERKQQLKTLYLYELAKTAVPWKKAEKGCPPSGELEFLSKLLVEGDTWGTFIAYSNVRAKNGPDRRELEKYLSSFDDPAEAEPGPSNDEMNTRIDLLDSIENKLTEKISTLTERADDQHIELMETLRELREDFARQQPHKRL
jgi:hypothetical protein